jgi:hypothetical protein
MEIEIVQSQKDLEEVYKLTHDVYVLNNYISPNPDGMLAHYPHLDNIPESIVIVAKVDGKIVGTNTFTIDGPNGLHIESEFPDVVKRLRKTPLKLSSTWRIITDPEYQDTKRVIKSVIRKTFEVGMNEADLVLATFNPKHERFYQRLLNFITIAGPRTHDKVGLMMTTKDWISKSRLIGGKNGT